MEILGDKCSSDNKLELWLHPLDPLYGFDIVVIEATKLPWQIKQPMSKLV
ncbi:hypothetical protein OsccyDRAFT_0525 [Leptolyngbyaceae cyanobacterium JSC-12]|nr:hypothetical protein OsccyDRAFT_0525 [Leptolyngbyaceae cyanobacterium JSC-12]